MIITRLFPSGALEISDIICGYRFSRVYYFYARKEAIKRFRNAVKEEKSKYIIGKPS